MSNPKIGTIKGMGPLHLDLDRLLETRLLIQANSGGGKSWNIRKLLEETHGKVQQIVLDIEGDFSSLREKYDFILAGKGGDIEASPKSAELLAHKVLELGVSIIIDLYELKQVDRISFVAKFLDAMTNAPKNLWHPVLVVIDEAHIFAPESGNAASMTAVVDLATRGRKRGFCAVFATQRLSKLNKDVAAECINKMIGRTGLDIDMKRAADELGFSKSDMLNLRKLSPGEFFCFGPALCNEVSLVEIGKVHTQHPRAGKREYVPVPPTNKVKNILSKLSDLPLEAEKELKDRASMLSKIRELEFELRKKPKPELDQEELNKRVKNAIANARLELTKQFKEELSDLKKEVLGVFSRIEKAFPMFEQNARSYRPGGVLISAPTTLDKVPFIAGTLDESYGKCEKLILRFLAMRVGNSFSKAQIGAMTGYSHGSGSFNNSMSKLRHADLVMQAGDKLYINESNLHKVESIIGIAYAHGDDQNALHEWLDRLGKCERNIYEKLLEEPDRVISKEELGQITGYSSSSGSFNNSISRLCTLGLATRAGSEGIQLNPELRGV